MLQNQLTGSLSYKFFFVFLLLLKTYFVKNGLLSIQNDGYYILENS